MKKITAIILSLILVLSIGLFAGCSGQSAKTPTDSNEAGEGSGITKLVLIDKDEKEYTYDLHVKEGTVLKDALYEEGLIDEETYYNMFVETIDGHTADTLNDGCTWLPLDEDGKQIMGMFDAIELHDGQTITLQYYKVPDMD